MGLQTIRLGLALFHRISGPLAELQIIKSKGKLGRTRSISARRGSKSEKATPTSSKNGKEQQPPLAAKNGKPVAGQAGQKDANLLSSN